ncbi:MAG: hypothetical protein IBJ16_11405 [Chitinophagaceae bacterium]|nr:hypothetical protein [Chitinophagaceae bacterium]
MNRYILSLILFAFQLTIYGQVNIDVHKNGIFLNGVLLKINPDKKELDSLLNEKSIAGKIIGSFNPDTKETNWQKRFSYHFKISGVTIEYYTKDKEIYSVRLYMKSSHRDPKKDNLITYPNQFKDGSMILDTSATMDQVIPLLDKQAVLSIGMRPYYPRKIPSIVYRKNDYYIELMFHPENKKIKEILIRR